MNTDGGTSIWARLARPALVAPVTWLEVRLLPHLVSTTLLVVGCAGGTASEQLWVDKYKPRNAQVSALIDWMYCCVDACLWLQRLLVAGERSC